MVEKRKVEVLVAGVGWAPCSFADVIEGDTFRIFEEDGTPVTDDSGETQWEACKDAYQMPDGAWCLETKDEE